MSEKKLIRDENMRFRIALIIACTFFVFTACNSEVGNSDHSDAKNQDQSVTSTIDYDRVDEVRVKLFNEPYESVSVVINKSQAELEVVHVVKGDEERLVKEWSSEEIDLFFDNLENDDMESWEVETSDGYMIFR